MRKIYLLFAATISSVAAFSQGTTVADSIQSGPYYGNEVYYSFESGKVKEAPVNEWQLAFSTGLFSATVRVNTIGNYNGDGAVKIYEVPGTDTALWSNFDTTGSTSWQRLENSDQSWGTGALNSNATPPYGFGWGLYDDGTHIITGQKLYLAVVTSSSTTLYKKIWVVNKNYGVWTVRFANIDGSDSNQVVIPNSYSTKNFVYLSLVNGTVIDREPATSDWDFVLTYYRHNLGAPMGYYNVFGILTNNGVITSEVRSVDKNTSTIADTTSTSAAISTIGYDWKQGSNPVDSLSYFVKAKNGAFWKLVFTRFVSGASASGTGLVEFNKTKLTYGTGVSTAGSSIKGFAVYPNPTSDIVNVLFDVENENSVISIMDLSGRTLFTQNVTGNGFQNQAVDVSSLTKGIYLLNVVNGNSRSVQKVVVN